MTLPFAKPNTVVDPASDLLILYNTNSSLSGGQPAADSLEVLNYYLDNRPGMGSHTAPVPTIVGCDCPPIGGLFEQINTTTSTAGAVDSTAVADYETYIRAPVLTALATRPSIKHILLIHGMPSRTFINPSGGGGHLGDSVQYRLSRCHVETGAADGQQYCFIAYGDAYDSPDAPSYRTIPSFTPSDFPGTRLLVTAITAANVADAKAMIDAIAQNRRSSEILVAPNNTKPAGGLYIFDDNNSKGYAFAADTSSTLLNANPSANMTVNPTTGGATSGSVRSATSIVGLTNWGFYGFSSDKNWMNDGGVALTTSSWWVLHTYNSYSGQRAGNHTNGETTQDDFTLYLAANAFGGSSYSECPVLLATSAEEPFGEAFNGNLMAAWDAGFIAIECGWVSRVTTTTQLIGDPYIAYYALLPRVADTSSATLKVGPGVGATIMVGG